MSWWKCRDTDWSYFIPLRRKTLEDGSISDHWLVMRRRVDGAWHYRRATPQELSEHEVASA